MKPEGYQIVKIPRTHIILKEDLQAELQARYDEYWKEHENAKARGDAPYTKTHFHGMMVACIHLAADFGIKLDNRD